MKDYDQNNIKVRNCRKSDIEYVAEKMRESDRQEIWASNHLFAGEALEKGIDKSIYCKTVVNGNPIAIFGICPQYLLGHRATIWMLGTEDLGKIKIRFLRHCREYINAMLEYYEYLDNYVDVRNAVSIAWLKFLGAKFDKPQAYGVDGELFQHFYFTKEK